MPKSSASSRSCQEGADFRASGRTRRGSRRSGRRGRLVRVSWLPHSASQRLRRGTEWASCFRTGVPIVQRRHWIALGTGVATSYYSCRREGMIEQHPTETRERSKGKALMSLAALGSAALASSCCLPLLPFVAAAGTAGSSAFFVKLRPFLVAASLGFLALGFYQGWREKQCGRKPRRWSTAVLWFSAIVVVAFTFFPQALANLIADFAGR